MSDEARTFRATVDQAEGDVVWLDVEGQRIKLPRAMLPGEVREGAGYVITLAAAPTVEAELKRSIEERLRALQSPQDPGKRGPT